MEDVFRRLAGVHAREDLVDDDAQVAAVSVSTVAHGIAAVDDEPMSREKPLGAEARHPLQRVRPLDGVALHLLRVAAVGRLPDDEVAA